MIESKEKLQKASQYRTYYATEPGSGDRDIPESKWQMAGQEAHAFVARTCAQSEDFARAELSAVQRFEESLQHQYDGQLRSHVDALQDECRDHVGQEEDKSDKMLKALQRALTQESSMCHDQLEQALRHHTCQEESADAQLRQLIAQQAEAMKRFESQSQQYVTQQHEEWTHKQRAQFQQFDGVIRDKDEEIQSMRRELATTRNDTCKSLTRLSRMPNAERSKAHQYSQGPPPSPMQLL